MVIGIAAGRPDRVGGADPGRLSRRQCLRQRAGHRTVRYPHADHSPTPYRQLSRNKTRTTASRRRVGGIGSRATCRPPAPDFGASVWPATRPGKSAVAQFEPGHRPRATPPPAPPRGQPCHEPKSTAAFRVPVGRAQLRHPTAAAIGDLHPDSTGTGRHRDRDRLPGKTRAAVPNAVAEKLAREQDSVILAGMLRAEDRAHECADNPSPFHKPGNLQALANRRPSHQRTAFPSARKACRGRTDARKPTLTSAAIVKPNTYRRRAARRQAAWCTCRAYCR